MNINSHSPQTIADLAYIAIAQSTNKFTKYEKGVLSAKNPEDLHQMRVGLRKLRSVIIGFEGVLKITQNINQKKIGKIAQILGKKRDLDVLTDNIKSQYYHKLVNEEKLMINRLIEQLEKEKHESLKVIAQTLHSKEYQKIKQSLIKWLENPQFTLVANQSIDIMSIHLIAPQISNFILAEGWLIGLENDQEKSTINKKLSSKKVNSLLDKHNKKYHQLRKEAKKTRYQMEFFKNIYGQEYQKYLSFVTAVQETLGHIQDNMVLIDTIKRIFGKKWSEKLPNLKIIIKENQYQEWQEWEKLQENYFQQITNKNILNLILSDDISSIEIEK